MSLPTGSRTSWKGSFISRYRGSLLGLEVSADFALVGATDGPRTGRRVALRRVTAAQLDDAWPKAGATRTNEQRTRSGRIAIGVDHHPVAGYRIVTPRHGRYVVAADGGEVLCAAPDIADWRWQRMLLSQALPVAATAQGLELLHAGGVTYGDGAVGLVGNAGSGKTSLGAHLVLRGASFLTDDVLALEPAAGGGLEAHPGPATLSLRSAESSGLTPSMRRRLGRRIGSSGKAVYEVAVDSRVLALSALYFLEPAAGGRLGIEPRKLDFPELVRHNFNWNVSTPARLQRLLEVASLISTEVSTYSARIPSSGNWDGVAELVEAHIEEHTP